MPVRFAVNLHHTNSITFQLVVGAMEMLSFLSSLNGGRPLLCWSHKGAVVEINEFDAVFLFGWM